MRAIALLRKVVAHALVCSLPVLLSGCFFLCTINEENSALEYDEQLLNDAMKGLLRRGGCALIPFTSMDTVDPGAELRWFGEQGEALGMVRAAGGQWLLRVSAEGGLRASHQGSANADTALSAARAGDDWVLMTCGNGVTALTRIAGATQTGAAYVKAVPGCDGAVGQATTHDSVAYALHRSPDALELGLFGVEGLSFGSARTTSLGGAIRFVGETSTGRVSVVTEQAGQWTYREVDATGATLAEHVTTEPGPAVGQAPVVHATKSGLLIASGDRLFAWNTAENGSVSELAAATATGLRSSAWTPKPWFGGAQAMDWEPNIEEPGLSVPLEYRSRAAGDKGFVVLSPPATPCHNDALCREIGESSLAGVIAHEGKPWGIYSTWAWVRLPDSKSGNLRYVHGVFASPLFEYSGEAAEYACPGTESQLDGGSGGGGPDSSAGGSGGMDASAEAAESGDEDASAGGASGEGGQGGASGAGGIDAGDDAAPDADGGSADAGEDSGEDAAGDDADAEPVETGPSFGQLPHIDSYQFNHLLPNDSISFELTGTRFDSTSQVKLFNTLQPTQQLSPTTLKVGPVTTVSQRGMFPMLVSGGTGGPYDSNTVYVRVHPFGPEMTLDDFGASSAVPGETLRVYGRNFPAADPPINLLDPWTSTAPAWSAGSVTWDGTPYQIATVTVPAAWTSGPLSAVFNTSPSQTFMTRYFKVGQDLARAGGATTTSSTAKATAPASHATDGDLSTHWMADTTCGSSCGSSGPELRVALASPSPVRRIVVRGNRTLPPDITNVVRSRLTLELAGGAVVWQDDWVHPPGNGYDLDITLPSAVPGVVAVSLRVLEDAGSFPSVAELAVFPD